MRENARKGMFDAFHILRKIADNLNQPVEKYGEACINIVHLVLHNICMIILVNESNQAYHIFLPLTLSLYSILILVVRSQKVCKYLVQHES